MIAAISTISETETHPQTNDSLPKLASYLLAWHLIFERGILSRTVVRGKESVVLKNIEEGFKFFVEWNASHQRSGKETVIKYGAGGDGGDVGMEGNLFCHKI